MPPTRSSARHSKSVKHGDGRKKTKDASPAAHHSGEGETDGRLLACPFFKYDPTQHIDCLLRNRLKSTSFVRQHLQRAHSQPIHCPHCGEEFKNEIDKNGHIVEQSCKRKEVIFLDTINDDQLMRIREPLRGLDERERWYSMWRILFPRSPPPAEPYVRSAQEEILDITRHAVKAQFPETSPRLLQFLNWGKVSRTYTNPLSHLADETSTSNDHWPPIPQSIEISPPSPPDTDDGRESRPPRMNRPLRAISMSSTHSPASTQSSCASPYPAYWSTSSSYDGDASFQVAQQVTLNTWSTPASTPSLLPPPYTHSIGLPTPADTPSSTSSPAADPTSISIPLVQGPGSGDEYSIFDTNHMMYIPAPIQWSSSEVDYTWYDDPKAMELMEQGNPSVQVIDLTTV